MLSLRKAWERYPPATLAPAPLGVDVPTGARVRRLIEREQSLLLARRLERGRPGFAEAAQLAATADRVEIRFAGHVPADVGLRRALEAKYSTIDHLDGLVEAMYNGSQPLTPEMNGFFGLGIVRPLDQSRFNAIGDRVRASGVAMVPTQILMDNYANDLTGEQLVSVHVERDQPDAARDLTQAFFTSLLVVFLACLCGPRALLAQTLDLNGQLSGWFIVNDQEPSTPVFSVRYLPSLMVERTFSEDRLVDGELSVNAFASAEAADWDRLSGTSRLKPYRAWARVKTSRFETRIGLQKINFGSATLIRPLMWFDSVDPRDPLQMTEGVYGVLPRFYLPNEITVWAWGLYGSDRTKGWEAYATREGTPELGGRVQVLVHIAQRVDQYSLFRIRRSDQVS